MLSSRSLTEEVQAFVCLDDAAYRACDQLSLTTYAQLTLHQWLKQADGYQLYRQLSGLDWATTTFERRYAATCRLTHDTDMWEEVERFSCWVEDYMYLTVGELRQKQLTSTDFDGQTTAASPSMSAPSRRVTAT